jgi:hypothetical protein
MKNLMTSVALYAVSVDVDGWKIASEIGTRVNKLIVSVLEGSRASVRKDPLRCFDDSGGHAWCEPPAPRVVIARETI